MRVRDLTDTRPSHRRNRAQEPSRKPRPLTKDESQRKFTSDGGQTSVAPGYAAPTSFEPTSVASGIVTALAVATANTHAPNANPGIIGRACAIALK